MDGAIPFIPGTSPTNPGPLARFLPPVPEGVVTAWLSANVPRGAWVLDPFGAAPRLTIEAARAGYRVLVAANNPVARFLLELGANPPQERELRAALAELAASHKGEERIEPHIRALYQTECEKCKAIVMAEAFLWDRGAAAPFGRIYTCPSCGDSGEHPVNEADVARAMQSSSSSLHRARALERVAPRDDPDRSHAEEALETYLPRAVYALFTLINKLDSLPALHRPHLAALLLAAFDQANTLWQHPTARSRPRQLIVPARFRENNIWLALEEAVGLWAAPSASPLPFTLWPTQPPAQGGISLYEGRLKDLTKTLSQIKMQAVLAVLPRPNQAYWTLSALWAGWLWGRESSAALKSVLRRRRYDWAWHATALHAALSNLAQVLDVETPFLGLMGESEPGFLSAALISAAHSGFHLSGLALRADIGQAQILWKWRGITQPPGLVAEKEFTSQVQSLSQVAGQAYLRARGEPSSYTCLHAAALAALAQSYQISTAEENGPAETLGQVQSAFQQAFTFRGGFLRYGGSEHSLEVGQWWLRDEVGPYQAQMAEGVEPIDISKQIFPPLSDRVEIELVRFLQKKTGTTWKDLDVAVCQAFPGLFTPGHALLQACLDSYGEQDPPESGHWRLRMEDSPRARRADLAQMSELLVRIGETLGLAVELQPNSSRSDQVSLQQRVVWRGADGEAWYAFYLSASAVLGKYANGERYPSRYSLLVVPGGRAGLLAYKMRADPRLAKAFHQGWRFVKFRLIRRLAEDSRLTQETIDAQLALDPLSNSDPQMLLL